MRNHKDLIVWQKSICLVKRTYELTRSFPREEVYGLTSQMQRAAVSIPSNIAEGYGRIYQKETINFLNIALGSAAELETQLIISQQLQYTTQEVSDELIKLVSEIVYMLAALMKKLHQE